MGKGLKALAKQEFERKVFGLTVLSPGEKCRTLAVGRKGDVEVVEGVPLKVILEKIGSRYETRTEFGSDKKVSKLYLMRKDAHVNA